MMARSVLGAVIATVAFAGLTACSSSNSSSDSSVDVHCNPVNGSWAAAPTNLNAERIASVLGVSVDKIKYGSMGSATCNVAVSEDAMQTDHPPIVKVNGLAARCLVMGTKDQPQAGAKTKDIMAVCPGSDSATS